MSLNLVFKSIQVDENTLVSLAKQDGFYYLNTVRGDLETKISFTYKSMEAISLLYNILNQPPRQATEN